MLVEEVMPIGIVFVPNSVAPLAFFAPVLLYSNEFRIHHGVVELAKGKIKTTLK